MTDPQENFRTMCFSTEEECIKFNNIWNLNVPFSTNYNAFVQKLANLEAQRIIQATGIKGIAIDKAELEKTLIIDTLKIAAAVKSFAADNNNNTLYEAVNFKKGKLENMRDTLLVDSCLVIRDAATNNLGSLGPYNVTSVEVGALTADINNYNAQLPKPRSGIIARKGATSSIASIIKDIRNHLEKKLDNNIETFNPSDFYTAYKNARQIPDTGEVDTGIEVKVVDATTGAAIKGALTIIVDTGSKKRTNDKGIDRYKKLSPGNNYTIQAKKKKYQLAQQGNIIVTKDNITKITIQLTKLP